MCRNSLHMGTVFYLWKLKRNFFIWMYTYIVNWKYIQTDVHKRHSHHPSSNDVPVKNDFYYILLYFSKRLFIQVDTYNILLYYLSYIPPYIKTLFFRILRKLWYFILQGQSPRWCFGEEWEIFFFALNDSIREASSQTHT